MIAAARSAAFALVASLLIVTPSHAEEPPVATESPEALGRAHFDKGIAFFRDQDFTAALTEFRRAYAIAPSYRILYNEGLAAARLHDYAVALTAFERYLREGGASIDPARRAEVEASVADLRGRVGHVTITTSPDGAEITIDNVGAGTSPLRAAMVNPGTHSVSLSRRGYTPVTKSIEIGATESRDLDVTLVAVPPASPAAPAPAPQPNPERTPPAHTPRTAAWIGLAVTGGLAVGTAAFGVATLGAKSTFEDRLGAFPGDHQAIDDARARVKTFSLITDVVGASAIVAAGITTYLFLSPGKEASVAIGPRAATFATRF